MNNIDLIIKARDYAIKVHSEARKTYGGLPYHVHLSMAVDFIHKFEYLLDSDDDIDDATCAGWLHDTVEDAGVTHNDVKKIVGGRIAALVCNLTTNIHGKCRSERANQDYYDRVKQDDISLFVKIADRLANTYYSLKYGDKYNTYKIEYPHFREMLYSEKFHDMWVLLDTIEDMGLTTPVCYEKITSFDDDNVHQIRLPKPIPVEIYKELYDKGIIPKKDLVKGAYYRGKCRNSVIALWNGFEFIYMRFKFGEYYVDSVNHIEDDNGFDLFIPVRVEKNPSETQKIKY